VAPTAADQASSAEETEPFKTDESAATPPPHPTYRMTTRISIPAPVPMPAWTDSEVVRLLAISSLPASPLSPWSSPPPQIPFPPLPPILSPPSLVLSPAPPLSPIRSLGYQAAMIRLRDKAASTSSPPLQLPSASRREDRSEVILLLQKKARYRSWSQIQDASDLVRGEVMSLRTTVLGQMSEIREVQAADRRRQTVISELLRIDHRRSIEITELRTALHGQAMIDQGVTAALAIRDALRSTNGDDSHNSKTGVRRTERATRECTYTDFHKLSKRKFKNTSRNTQNQQQQHSNKRQNTGRVYIAASGEKKQYGGSKPLCAKCNYHHDGPCAPKCRNCNKIGHFARDCRSAANTNNANNQRGTRVGQKITCYKCGVQGHYKRECPKLKNNNNHGNQGGRNNAPARVYAVGRAGTDPDANVVTGQRYQELALLCGRMFSEESDKIEKYVGGLLDIIHGSVVASKPKTMHEAIEIATELMDKKIHTFAERETASKRKFENTSRNT
nr:hypothetical protein [Tanacetum cinerariifolium]